MFSVVYCHIHSSVCTSSDYNYNTNKTLSVNSEYFPHRTNGPGVYEAVWKLAIAMLFKGIITIFTFGVKVIIIIFLLVFVLLHNSIKLLRITPLNC